jgi:hypothetical protein
MEFGQASIRLLKGNPFITRGFHSSFVSRFDFLILFRKVRFKFGFVHGSIPS